MIYVGIDPGKKGGIVGLKSNGDILFKHVMPMQGKQVYTPELVTYFMYPEEVKIMIEIPIPMPRQGVKGTATTFLNYGVIIGALEAEHYEWNGVEPKVWQAEMLDVNGKTTKDRSVRKAEILWPDENFEIGKRAKKVSDGLTDAALIAEYFRRGNDNYRHDSRAMVWHK